MFKGILVMAALGVCLYFAVRGPSSYEAVMEESLSAYEDVADILSNITDEKSAKLAKPKLEALKVAIEDLERSAKSLKPATPQEEQNLQREFTPKLRTVMSRIFNEMMRLAEIPAASRQLAGALPLLTIPCVTPSKPSATKPATCSTRKSATNSSRRVKTKSRRVPS